MWAKVSPFGRQFKKQELLTLKSIENKHTVDFPPHKVCSLACQHVLDAIKSEKKLSYPPTDHVGKGTQSP